MVGIKSIKKKKYTGYVYDLTLKNNLNPYFFVNGVCSHNSLYPSIMHQCNIFSPDPNGWNGNGKFKVEGKYKQTEQGEVEKLIKKMYEDRVEFKKKGDPREYSLKIQMNACFDKDTDILLTSGITNIRDCTIGDLAYSINKITGKTEIKPIIDVQKIPYNGDMIHFENKNIDLMVTPDHDMLYKRTNDSKIETIKASEFITKKYNSPILIKKFTGVKEKLFDIKKIIDVTKCDCYIKLDDPYSQRQNKTLHYDRGKRIHFSLIGYNPNLKGKWIFQKRKGGTTLKEFYPIKDFLYLIGILISKGSISPNTSKYYKNGNHRGVSYRIGISQYELINKDIYNKIKTCLDNLNIQYSYHNKGFNISSDMLYNFYLNQIGKYSHEKHIPSFLFEYDHSLLKYLHEGLYDGDGNKSQYRYTTNSKKLKNDMIKLNFLLGYRTTVSNDSNVYRIFRTGPGLIIKPGRSLYTKVQNNDNYVYCVTVADNNTVYVGRNGKMSWCGQCYGLLGNPCFAKLYNRTSAADVTRIGRQWVKLSRKRFTEAGYEVIYTDTDSVYLVDVFDDKDKMLECKDKIIKEIKDNIPFPYENFDMGIDDEITDMFFFKGETGDKATDSEMDKYDKINKPKKLIKKNYVYRTTDGKIKVKNLGVRKKSLSQISRSLFWDVLVPRISEERVVKFSEAFIKNKIFEMLEADISKAQIRYSVKPADSYKVEHQIQAQIARRYGPGIHFLIPNLRGIGVGKKKSYCTLEEFNKNNLKVSDIALSNVWKELGYFIKSSQSLLSDFLA